jgi:hypothetical protein
MLAACLDGCSQKPPSPEALAADTIAATGGRMTRDNNLPGRPIVEIRLAGHKASDVDGSRLKDLTCLRVLDLAACPVTDVALHSLRTSPPCRIFRSTARRSPTPDCETSKNCKACTRSISAGPELQTPV